MKPAIAPRGSPLAERLLHIDPAAGRFSDARVADLARLVRPGDLLVLNDGATLPASLHGRTAAGAAIEARLVQPLGGMGAEGRFSALLFGDGDYRTRTEDRPAPPPVVAGDALDLGPGLGAVVERVWPASRRLVDLRFHARGAALWSALYRHGRPIQYAYVPAPLELWDVQTRYAGPPVCAEMPSAGRPLAWELLLDFVRRGVGIAGVTHAAGISSTGDTALDALLPVPERFHIPQETARALRETKARGGRVVAVGTTAARALEGAAALAGGSGTIAGGAGVTDLILGPGTRPRVVDGLLTGMHTPSESHYQLLEVFAPAALLRRAHEHAEAAGYLAHEFGDSTLILAA
jgi:S-adenosylmethionine:tRNA ribosyltransferase-isomerase